MAIREKRMKGVARSGKIELEPTVFIADGTIVEVVMVQDTVESDQAGLESSFLASLREGFYLGGGPYLNRDEFYGDSGRPR